MGVCSSSHLLLCITDLLLLGHLHPGPHTQPLLQQEYPELEVEVLPLEAGDPLPVVPHGPVQADAGVAAGVLRPAQRVRVVIGVEDLGTLTFKIIVLVLIELFDPSAV